MLTGKQKRFLRSQAHHLQPIFQIGKGGVNVAMNTQIAEALEKRELIKVSLLQNTDEVADEAALEIAQAQTVKSYKSSGGSLCYTKLQVKKNTNA